MNNNNQSQEPYIDKGPMNFGSQSMRHLYFDVDKVHAKRYNESYKGDKKFLDRVYIATVIFILLTVWLYTVGFWWGLASTLVTIVLCGISYIGYTRAGKPESLFHRGVLNAGIIAKIDEKGIGLLVLAEVTTIIGDYPKWGLQSIIVKELPGHKLVVGERVPVTCTFSSIKNDAYEYTSPTVIAWGTRDPEVIKRGIESVSDVEWRVLESSINRYIDNAEWNKNLSDHDKLFQRFTDEEVHLMGLDKA